MELFHRHAFCEIPRLIHITPSPHRDVVRQQLEGDYFQDGQQQFVRLGDVDYVFDELGDVGVAFDGYGDDAAGAGGYFLDVA